MSRVGMSPTKRSHLPRRRGASLIIVMMLVAVTLAMSYALMRSQVAGVQLEMNTERGNSAEQAAMAGLSAGLRAMRQSSWGGVTSTLNGNLNATDSYSVTYTPGDSSLLPAMSAYSEYPLRVTLTSTGTSIDPAHPSVSSTYKVQAVARLVPRQLSAVPSNWATMMGYTMYQLTSGTTSLAVPCHIDGAVRLQNSVDISNAYSWSDTAESRYYADLNQMRTGINEVQTITTTGNLWGGSFTVSFNGSTSAAMWYNASSATVQATLQNMSTIGSGNVTVASTGTASWSLTFTGQLACQNVPQVTVNTGNLFGYQWSMTSTTIQPGASGMGDYRPFSGPMYAPTTRINSRDYGLLTSQLAVTVNNISQVTAPAPTTSTLSSYRLYPGGPTYNAATLPANASNVTLSPDPVTNPLGLFYCNSSATLGSNVTITGTVATSGDLVISGTNVRILPFNAMSLSGTTTPVRLPAVISQGNFRVAGGATATINGFMVVAQKFLVDQGAEATNLSITGNVIVGSDISIGSRTEWNAYGGSQWSTFYSNFLSQLGRSTTQPFFPVWLSTSAGRSYLPTLNVQQDTANLVAQWQDFGNPLYVIGSSDTGLRWDLVSWKERP